MGTAQVPQVHQPSLSSRKIWSQHLKSHFPSSRLHARWDTLSVWGFLSVSIFLKMINVLPRRGGSCQPCPRRGPLAEAVAVPGVLMCLERQEVGVVTGRMKNGTWKEQEVRTTALGLRTFCHESVETGEETEDAWISVQSKIYL